MVNIVIMLITVIMVTGLMMVTIIILTKASTLALAHPSKHAHDGHRHHYEKDCQPWLWPPCHHAHPSNHAHVGQHQHSDKSVNLGSGLPGRLCLSGHRPLQLDWEPSILAGGGED